MHPSRFFCIKGLMEFPCVPDGSVSQSSVWLSEQERWQLPLREQRSITSSKFFVLFIPLSNFFSCHHSLFCFLSCFLSLFIWIMSFFPSLRTKGWVSNSISLSGLRHFTRYQIAAAAINGVGLGVKARRWLVTQKLGTCGVISKGITGEYFKEKGNLTNFENFLSPSHKQARYCTKIDE